MENVTLKSIKARYPMLFPLKCGKDDFIKTLDFTKSIEDKQIVINSNSMDYKPLMIGFLLKYLSTHNKYPTIKVLNVHEVIEIYLTDDINREILTLSDINHDILFLTAGYSEPNNKAMKDCVGFLMNNYCLKDKYLFIYLKGTSLIVKDIESLAKSLEIPFYSYSQGNISSATSKSSKTPLSSSKMDLF